MSTTSKRPIEDTPSDVEEPEAGPSTTPAERPRDLVKSLKKKRKSSAPSPGIVYVSRLPPGMTPQKVKHLMARWGEVGRVYAQKRDAPTGYNPQADKKKKQKHAQANYSEAWVEFLDKSVAKTVASMLNAQVIGGKKGDRWRDDIWTMKYLSGFKWEMLGEQVAYERQAHTSRLRNEITRSKAEQGEYLRNVELARVLDKRRAKKAEAGDEGQSSNTGGKGTAEGGSELKGADKAKRTYKQRQAVDRDGMKEKSMESVLGSVFG